MAEQRFLRKPQSTAAQPPPPNPKRTEIQINWNVGVLKAIEIRRDHIELDNRSSCIHLKPGCQQGHDALVALIAQAHIVFAP